MYAPKTYLTLVLDGSSSMENRPWDYSGGHRNAKQSEYSLWNYCVTSMQDLVALLQKNYRPEQGDIMVRAVRFSSGYGADPAKQIMGWKKLGKISTKNDMSFRLHRAGGTPTADGIWEAIEGVQNLNDKEGMELEAASVVVMFTDGGDTGGLISDAQMKPRIEALQDSGQWTFVGMYCMGERGHAEGNMRQQADRWGLNPDYQRAFTHAKVTGQWAHLADQILSYVEARAQGKVKSDDLKET